MQADAHRPGARLQLQHDVEALDQLVHAGLGRAVAVPAAARVVGDAADARGHEGHDGGGAVQAVDGVEHDGFLLGEERAEVLQEHHGREEVEFERRERGGVGDFVGRAFGDEHARDEEGEAQVRGGVGLGAVVVAGAAVGGGGGDGGLGVEVEGLDVEAGGLRGAQGEGVEDAGFGAGEVGAGGRDDGEGRGRGAEEVPGQGEADAAG